MDLGLDPFLCKDGSLKSGEHKTLEKLMRETAKSGNALTRGRVSKKWKTTWKKKKKNKRTYSRPGSRKTAALRENKCIG